MKKKARRSKNDRKSRHDVKHHPQQGISGSGETVDPFSVSQELEFENAFSPPKAAPAPGVPISIEEYERLKKKSKTARKLQSGHVQEDPSHKK